MVYRVAFAATNDPLSHAIHSLKKVVEDALSGSGSISYSMYLGHPDIPTFRHELATIDPYKGNRTSPRPEHYQDLRDYLIRNYGAEVCMEWEADDAVSMLSCSRNDVVIVTNDKDLNTVPGMKYNWVKRIFFNVTELEARRNFWSQMISGDTSDNIRALRGHYYRAQKVLADCTEEEDFMSAVFPLYAKHYPNPLEVMQETGTLLHMLRHPEDKYELPNLNIEG